MAAWPGSLGPADLARFRIVYAACALAFLLPRWSWTTELPESWFAPPPGPLALLAAPPPGWLLSAGGLVLGGLLGALLVGYRTRVVSWAIPIVWLAGNGVAYSWGKIDHEQLAILAPLFLGAAGWGDALSLDARRGRTGPPRRWPVTLFAVAVALAVLTAAVPKVRWGWLSPDSDAVRGHLFRNQLVHGRDQLLAPWAAGLELGGLWQVADVATVLVEAAPVLLLVRRSTFRLTLLGLTVFHWAVLLAMNITFTGNVLAYGAFFSWSTRAGVAAARSPAVGGLAVLGLAAGAAAAGGVLLWDATLAEVLLGGLGLSPLLVALGPNLGLGLLWIGLELRERGPWRAAWVAWRRRRPDPATRA